MPGSSPRWFTRPKTVTHLVTNRTRRRVTTSWAMSSFLRSPRLSIRDRKSRLHLVSDKTDDLERMWIKVIGDSTIKGTSICWNHLKSTAVLYRWVQWCSSRVSVRLTPGPLQATLSKLLTYCVLRPTQPPTLSGTGNE